MARRRASSAWRFLIATARWFRTRISSAADSRVISPARSPSAEAAEILPRVPISQGGHTAMR
jgi:hypothetical protein